MQTDCSLPIHKDTLIISTICFSEFFIYVATNPCFLVCYAKPYSRPIQERHSVWFSTNRFSVSWCFSRFVSFELFLNFIYQTVLTNSMALCGHSNERISWCSRQLLASSTLRAASSEKNTPAAWWHSPAFSLNA